VLLNVLEDQFKLKLQPKEFLAEFVGEEEEGTVLDIKGLCGKIQRLMADTKGFEIRLRVVLGNFAFQKMAMVKDLQECANDLPVQDVIAAIAGDSKAKSAIKAEQTDPDPREFDRIPPDNECLVLDADSRQQRAIALQALNKQDHVKEIPKDGSTLLSRPDSFRHNPRPHSAGSCASVMPRQIGAGGRPIKVKRSETFPLATASNSLRQINNWVSRIVTLEASRESIPTGHCVYAQRMTEKSASVAAQPHFDQCAVSSLSSRGPHSGQGSCLCP
jgi:hypothetical protein